MNNYKKNLTRRTFIKGALAGSSLILGGCSSLDSLFTESRRIFGEEVIIVGAGLAGLAAAYHLKKNKIPYRLFEASERVGGRVYSISGFGAANLWGELGAEFVNSNQTAILSLAKEMNLKPQLLAGKTNTEDIYLLNDKILNTSALKKSIPSLILALKEIQFDLYQGQTFVVSFENANRFRKIAEFDEMSVSDLENKLAEKVDPILLKIVVRQMENKYGVSAKNLSALHFINEMKFLSSDTYVLPGGWTRLTQTLYERVSGGVPFFLVRNNYQLLSISKNSLGISLNFKTPTGRRNYSSQKVILALPPSAMKNIGGFESLDISSEKLQLLKNQKMGRTKKGIFLANNLQLGTSKYAIGDFNSECIWESTNNLETSVFSYQHISDHMTSQLSLEQDLVKLNLKNKDTVKEFGPQIDWNSKKFSEGSISYFAPGEYSKWNGLYARSELQGRIQFAGEHCSTTNRGTMEGAVQSGIAAAEAFIKLKV